MQFISFIYFYIAIFNDMFRESGDSVYTYIMSHSCSASHSLVYAKKTT
jgi:hypothetical protein